MSSTTIDKLIEDIISKLIEDVKNWKSNLKLKVESEFQEVLKNTLEKYSNIIENVEKELTLEKESKLYEISLNYKKEKLKLLNEYYQKIINKIKEKIINLRGTESYEKYFKKLIENVIDGSVTLDLTIDARLNILSEQIKSIILKLIK